MVSLARPSWPVQFLASACRPLGGADADHAFAVFLGWLPSNGRGETREIFGVGWSFLTADGWAHLILPAVNLALFKLSLLIRLTRAGVREALAMDYVKFARAKGLSASRIVGCMC